MKRYLPKKLTQKLNQSGMTLIEILIVLAIVAGMGKILFQGFFKNLFFLFWNLLRAGTGGF